MQLCPSFSSAAISSPAYSGIPTDNVGASGEALIEVMFLF